MIDEIETLDVLPGEGETEMRKRVRVECHECGEPAHFKVTFLLDNARSNPASNGYRKDDISWCEDEALFTCREHADSTRRNAPDGYGWCSSFSATAQFAHMFLRWKRVD